MKKLDEIMELMADEMADFKSAVLQLQKHSEQLSQMSIPISTEALEKNLNQFLKKQELESQERGEILKSIDLKLKNTKLIPNYLLILFGISGILAMASVGYFAYTANERLEEKFEVYRIFSEYQNKGYENYFATFPEVYNAYCLWLEAETQDL